MNFWKFFEGMGKIPISFSEKGAGVWVKECSEIFQKIIHFWRKEAFLNETSLYANSRSKIRLGVKLTIHCGVCVKKMAAQWILCRLEGVMQAT